MLTLRESVWCAFAIGFAIGGCGAPELSGPSGADAPAFTILDRPAQPIDPPPEFVLTSRLIEDGAIDVDSFRRVAVTGSGERFAARTADGGVCLVAVNSEATAAPSFCRARENLSRGLNLTSFAAKNVLVMSLLAPDGYDRLVVDGKAADLKGNFAEVPLPDSPRGVEVRISGPGVADIVIEAENPVADL